MTPTDTAILGRSPELLAVLRAARLVAVTQVPVLVQGESGTGKELLAQALHAASPRRDKPFVAVNCAALPETLVESELFGHTRGAFSGAVADRPGRLQAAHGGTLFLDEIGEMPLPLQGKLLRFLQSGECQTLGSELPRRVDTRVVAASNRDLAREVKEGRFREDLFYRLHVVPLRLPPLRERSGDALLLLDHFLDHFARVHGQPRPQLSRETRDLLARHPWPGNVRELRNLCERLAILHAGTTLAPGDLPPEYVTPPPAWVEGLPFPDEGIDLAHVERSLIRRALDKADGNQSRAARLLGLTRDTLLYRLKKHSLP